MGSQEGGQDAARESKDATPPPPSALKSFVSGGIGGICLVLVGHPLDLVKVRMQTQGVGAGNTSPIQMLRTTMQREGVRGLYRGVSMPILAVAPMFAVCFWGYDMGQRLIRTVQNVPADTPLSIPQLVTAGALSSLPVTALMAPSERIKCLLQVQANETGSKVAPKYTTMRECALYVYKEGGIRSVYKGTVLTLWRDVPGGAVYFGTYEFMKRYIIKHHYDGETKKISPAAVLFSGGLAGMANWCVSIPPDVLKSRFQTAPPEKYSGMMDVYREVIREEGHAGLFRGLRPALMRAFPANAACFFGMELSRSLLTFMD